LTDGGVFAAGGGGGGGGGGAKNVGSGGWNNSACCGGWPDPRNVACASKRLATVPIVPSEYVMVLSGALLIFDFFWLVFLLSVIVINKTRVKFG
jgi:hypothetical protein